MLLDLLQMFNLVQGWSDYNMVGKEQGHAECREYIFVHKKDFQK